MTKRISRRQRRHTKKALVMLGGDGGASGFGVQAYGGIGQQVANPVGGNVILVHPDAAGGNPSPAAVIKGGAEPEAKADGGALQELAVPAVLLVANQMIRKRRPKSHKKRFYRKRRSNRKGRA
jgi:hypothetical protein